MHTLEFFFDCSSPWTYLAFESVQKLKARVDFDIVWRPILVGGVFNQVNPSVYENRAKPVPAKARYYQKDLQDWARYVGITIGQPPVFPVNSVKAMRGAFVALEHGCLEAYARRVFHRYWGDLADISQDDVLSRHRLGVRPSGRRVLREDRHRDLQGSAAHQYRGADRIAAASARRRCSSTATTCTSATTDCS